MSRLLLIAVILACTAVAQVEDVYYQGDIAPRNIMPSFDKGYLVAYESNDAISLYGREGKLAYKATPTFPGTDFVQIHDAAADTDGAMVASVESGWRDPHHVVRHGMLAVFSPSGVEYNMIDTGIDWAPVEACFAQDHSIWTLGWRGINSKATTDYGILRHYDREGHLLGEFLPRSSFAQEPVGPHVGGWHMTASTNRIAFTVYTHSVLAQGMQHRLGQWTEVDFQGNIARKLELPRGWAVCAFTANGTVYAADKNVYQVFDSSIGTWRPIPGVQGGWLNGADGDILAFTIANKNMVSRTPLQ